MKRIVIKAYAKINLALDVLNERPDGYHEVEMILQGINLYDVIELTVVPEAGIYVECPYPELGDPEENLAYKAADLLRQETGFRQGVRIIIKKNIPVAAGLGGGSSDAAAVLVGLNRLLGLALTREMLLELAGQLGSDVPFCLWPATAVARGRGELLTEVSSPEPLWLVLCKPPYGVSTARAYRNLHNVEILKRPDITGLLADLTQNNFPEAYNKMVNVLEYSTFALFPELQRQAGELKDLGACHVMISGSGPTLLAFVSGEEEAIKIVQEWPRKDWFVTVTRSLRLADLQERMEIYEG